MESLNCTLVTLVSGQPPFSVWPLDSKTTTTPQQPRGNPGAVSLAVDFLIEGKGRHVQDGRGRYAATRAPNTILHCLYAFYVLCYTRHELAHVFNKCESTISNWIRVYEATGTCDRATTKISRKFKYEHRAWLPDYYTKRPLAYIDEAQAAFKIKFFIAISRTTVWRIIHEHGLTWKVLERRAMHIKEKDAFRFVKELSIIDWSQHNLVFRDEVSFDNRGTVRKRGYAMKGTKLAVRGDFSRKPRVSLLAFWGSTVSWDITTVKARLIA